MNVNCFCSVKVKTVLFNCFCLIFPYKYCLLRRGNNLLLVCVLQESPEVPDLIKLDSTASSEDFDPLLSKSSEFTSSKQMTQSLHIPEMGEGLSNPLYPYFQPLHKSNDKQQKSSDNIGDLDLLQAYGLDFNKFSISNDDSPTKKSNVCNTSENSINIDNTFSLTLNTPAIKSQNNWTKFE